MPGSRKDEHRADPADARRARGPHGDAVDGELARLGEQPRRVVLGPDAGASRDQDDVRPRSDERIADLLGVITEPDMPLDQAAVAGDERAQHGRVRVVNLVPAFWRSGGDHFIAGDEDADARPLDDVQLRQPQGGEQTDVLRTQAPARTQHRRALLDVLAAASDVLTGGDRERDFELPRRLGGVLGRQDRIESFRHWGAGHDPDRCVGPCRAGEGLAGQRLTEHGQGERVVLAGTRRLGAAQGIAVHCGAIERGHAEWSNYLGSQDAVGGLVQRHRLVAQTRGVPIDPVQHGGNLAALPEPVHAYVG